MSSWSSPDCCQKAMENVGSSHPLGPSWLFWDHHCLTASEWRALMFSPQCLLIRGYGTMDFIDAKPELCAWVTVCLCVQILFYSWLQTEDEMCASDPNRTLFAEGQPEWRRALIISGFVLTLFYSEDMQAKNSTPKGYYRARLESTDRLSLTPPKYP